MKKLIMLLTAYSLSLTPSVAQSKWTQRISLPSTPRGYGIGFSIGNYGYVGLGGRINSGWEYFTDFWQFDPSSNSWTRKADFPGKARICPATFVIGKYAYVVSGSQNNHGNDMVSECWQYNSVTNIWTRKHDFPGISRYSAVGFAIGSKGFIGTGYDTLYDNVMKDFWEYDTTSDAWTKKNDFGGIARYSASGFAVGGKGYICFGVDSDGNTYSTAKDIWEYSIITDSWMQKSNNPIDSLAGTNGFVIGSDIYVGVGETYFPVIGFADFWKYTPTSDAWIKQANFIGGKRAVCSAFSIGDTGYLGLGVYDSIFNGTNTMYRFLPDSITGINEIFNGQELSLFPNPANQKLNITFKRQDLGLVTLSIMDITGREILLIAKNENSGSMQIDVSSLTTGMYFINIKNKDLNVTQKFIKY
ncbi:MAG TPA: T9SS type A sorting domain-containing protein [Bacteroidia bacterium]|jgi:N-acetylneuraminic acid mutarotase|nr:T9SS type A sorting domain-containing protein [Bacteroidia bacterium]